MGIMPPVRINKLNLKMNKTLLLLAAVGFVATLSVQAESTLNFDFSFSDANGTIAGEIYGLSDNSTSAASQVVITSFPDDINAIVTAPVVASDWTYIDENSFTVTDGEITGGGFYAHEGGTGNAASLSQGYQLFIDGNYGGAPGGYYNYCNLDGTDSAYVYGGTGLGAVTFASAEATPEPGTIALAGLGIAGLMAARRRK